MKLLPFCYQYHLSRNTHSLILHMNVCLDSWVKWIPLFQVLWSLQSRLRTVYGYCETQRSRCYAIHNAFSWKWSSRCWWCPCGWYNLCHVKGSMQLFLSLFILHKMSCLLHSILHFRVSWSSHISYNTCQKSWNTCYDLCYWQATKSPPP